MASDSNTSSGIGFTSALALLFIGLKLGNVIDWSWWWVLSPFWIPIAIVLIVVATIWIVQAPERIAKHLRQRRRFKRMLK